MGIPQDQQQAASGAFDGGASGPGLTSRDAILRVIRRNLDSRRMPPQSTKDGRYPPFGRAVAAVIAKGGLAVKGGLAETGIAAGLEQRGWLKVYGLKILKEINIWICYLLILQ